jgi:hypothetical protein
VAGLQQAAVRDKQDALKLEAAGQLAHPLNCAPAEHDSRARFKVEWDHLL